MDGQWGGPASSFRASGGPAGPRGGVPMSDDQRDPWLLTPGPLTTSATVKAAMLHDGGSREGRFIAINRRVRERLVEIVGGEGSHVCVPLQGSGTFAVEAMLGTFVPRNGKLLILVNGAYGKRMARMMGIMGRAFATVEAPEDQAIDPAAVAAALEADPAITHVAIVHCETTSGVLNPVAAIADILAAAGRRLLIDGMRPLGLETLLPNQLQAPIIVTFRMPADDRFVFDRFYDRLREQGYVIYPGKLTVADSFRIGCIGRLGEAEMKGALDAVRRTMAEMCVASGAPARRAATP